MHPRYFEKAASLVLAMSMVSFSFVTSSMTSSCSSFTGNLSLVAVLSLAKRVMRVPETGTPFYRFRHLRSIVDPFISTVRWHSLKYFCDGVQLLHY